MHGLALALLRFSEYMSSVYIEEEFGDLFQPESDYDYFRRQVTTAQRNNKSRPLLRG
jgi:hypothetical protein